MARVVVVGGGYGGLAVAARLARQHDVALVERSEELGGALVPVRSDGFTWDGAASHTLLPAVVRDLFRKTGRPIEREVDLVPVPVLREHRFVDGSSLLLPGASRSHQRAALDELAEGLGEQWLAWVDRQGETWEVLRRGYLENAHDPTRSPSRADAGPEAAAYRATARVLADRTSLRHDLRRAFRDDRLVDVGAFPVRLDGHDPRDVPAWVGVVAYLEQCFGAWRVAGGTHRLLEALEARLDLRGVTLHRSTEALDVEVRSGRAAAVRTTSGTLEADVVVCAIDPRRLPALAGAVRATMPAMPPSIVHVGFAAAEDFGPQHELVLHGDPLVIVRPGGTAPDGHLAWTLLGRGLLAEDLLDALARHRVDLRDRLAVRVDRSPRTLVEQWGGSPLGVLWAGRGTVRRRLGPRTPVPGVYAVGAHATPGSGLPFVGLSAALAARAVADDLGERSEDR